MGQGDIINIEILEDGTIKATTDPISQANHLSAERFFSFLKGLCGGDKTIKPRHQGAHMHSHGSITHSH